jgi:DNA modification methylase
VTREADPTIKPVELTEGASRNCKGEGQRILARFAGSGSTLIACANTRLGTSIVEIDLRYIDVRIKRRPVNIGRDYGGQGPFHEVLAETADDNDVILSQPRLTA